MDLFGKVTLVEVPVLLLPAQKAWLEMMVRKGKIAVPPGGTLPEGSVISIFMRTLLWNAEEIRQSLAKMPAETLESVMGKDGLVETRVQVSVDQQMWLDAAAASGSVPVQSGDTPVSLFVRAILANAMEQQTALERADPWADDDEEE